MGPRYGLGGFVVCFMIFPCICQDFSRPNFKLFRKPEIYPPLQYTILEPNDNITLFCLGDEPLEWTLPNVEEVPCKEERNWTKFIKQFTKLEGQYHRFNSTLQIINITHHFVGFYGCHEVADASNSNNIYLYVNETEHLSMPESVTDDIYHIVYGTQNKEVIIPCRPTSPFVDVTFTFKNDKVDLLNLKDSMYHADPMYGIITNDTQSIIRGILYTCKFTRFNKTTSFNIDLIVEASVDHIDAPQLAEDSAGHMIEGNTLILKCWIKAEIEVDFYWITPRGSIEYPECSPDGINVIPNGELDLGLTILNITNVSRSIDKGNYVCVVKDKQNHSSSTSLYVNIFRANDNFINVYPINVTYIVVPAGQPIVQLNVIIESHPRANINWYSNKFDIITNSSNRYEINYNRKTNVTFLKIKNVIIEDTGYYNISATNNKTENKTGFFLNVTGPPSAGIEADEFHLVNTYSIIKCFAMANPEPRFKWEYKDCTTDKCNFMPINATSNVSKNGEFNFTSEIIIFSNKSRSTKCTVKNTMGSDSTNTNLYVSDLNNGFDIFGLDSTVNFNEETMKATVAVNDTIRITCGASVYKYNNISWVFKNQVLKNTNGYIILPNSTQNNSTKTLQLEITRANFSVNGLYECRATLQDGKYISKNITFIVADPQKPKIINITNTKDIIEMNLPEELIIACAIRGIPKPQVTWFKDGDQFNPSEPDRIQINGNREKITFKHTDEKDEGTYRCEGKNKAGVVSKQQSIKFKNLPEKNPKWLIYITISLSVLFVIAIIFIIIKIRKEKLLQWELEKLGLANFEKGEVQNINTKIGINDQADLLPYNKKWEYPIENLKIGKQLGLGAFGVVMKAEAKNIVEGEPVTTVAVKKAKKEVDSMYIRALASELKIMVHLGKHLNIVNLLGACTKNIAKRELLVIVEYCQFGNLQNHLFRHRDVFKNQIDANTGQVDFSIGQGFINRSYSLSSDKSKAASPPTKYASLAFPEGCPGKIETPTIPEGKSSSRNYAPLKFSCSNDAILPEVSISGKYRDTVATEMVTISEDEGVILSNNSEQPEWRSNYKGDYKGNVKPIYTMDLLVWAFQVASGMEYLASRKVLHGDLAARNILLADNNIVKICDFGLAKTMYNDDNYKKQSKGLLPLKWMAIESITDRIFSTQSDVWSFGIVLWEFFSLAKSPYPGIEGEVLYQYLLDGNRMASPPYAPREIYNMMTKCWDARPMRRPSFTKLAKHLGDLVDESSRKYFLELNAPYLKVNMEHSESGEDDYTKMMCTPTFEALSSPHYVNENIEQSEEDYLRMDPIAVLSPRRKEGVVFDFNVSKRNRLEVGDELEASPMLPSMGEDSTTKSDVPLQTTPDSFSNPIYHEQATISDKTIDDGKECKIIISANNYVDFTPVVKDRDQNSSSPTSTTMHNNSEKIEARLVDSDIEDRQAVPT